MLALLLGVRKLLAGSKPPPKKLFKCWAIIRKAGRSLHTALRIALCRCVVVVVVEKFSCSGHCLNGFMGSFAVVIGVEIPGIFGPFKLRPCLCFAFFHSSHRLCGIPYSIGLIRSFISLMGCKWGASVKVNYTLSPGQHATFLCCCCPYFFVT